MDGNKGNIIIYQSEDGVVRLDVRLEEKTVGLTLDQKAELFQRNKSTISRNVKNIFECGELNVDSTVAFFAKDKRRAYEMLKEIWRTTASIEEGVQSKVYNMDRLNSKV